MRPRRSILASLLRVAVTACIARYETYYLSKFVLDEDGEKVHDADGNEIIEPVPETEKALIRSIQSTMLFRKRTQTIDELAASGIKDTTDNSALSTMISPSFKHAYSVNIF